MLVLLLGGTVANAQVTTLQNWSVLYNNTSTNQQTVSYTVPTGSNSNRILAVAIASSQTSAGSRTVSISYGGRNLTLAAGDMTSTTPRQHTAIYYLNEADLDLASNTNLVFRVSGQSTRVTTVWAAVFDYVDQTTPVTDSENYNTGTGTADPFVFGTALTINANDQAVLVVSSLRSGSTTPRTYSFPTNFTSANEQTWTTTDGVRNGVGNRSVPTSNTSSTCSTNLSNATLGSMTGVSFKGCVPATANAGGALVAICQGGTSAALGGSVGGSATGGTWSSSVSGGTFTPNATNLDATWTPPANYSGTATLTLTSSGGSCGVATASKTLVVNPLPSAITAGASVTSICAGSPFNLTSSATSNSSTAVTLVNENFNGSATGWTTANTSAGGTPANSAWTIRTNGYSVCPTCGTTENLNSNDSSSFYLSDSDRQGSGGTTATILQSPTFSTVGLTDASLNFFHYYRDWDGTDFAYVEVSTDGTNWTALNTYTTTQGASNGFLLVTTNLSGYLNQPTVSIRFRYAGVYAYYWAIDNVSVTGTAATPPAPTYAWTSTPSGFTSSLQNPTGVTQTVATVYTVTVTNSFGCSASASTSSVAITPATVGGSVSGTANICAGSNSGLLTLSGHTGSIVRWESAVSPFTTWVPIVNANTTYTSGSLTETTRFRTIVQSGDCAQASSASATITVSTPPSAGTLSGTQSICSNGTTTFASTVSGGAWTSGNTAVATINSASGVVTPVAAGTATMTYTVTGTGGCANATATRTVTVTAAPSAGTLSGTQSVCSNGTTTFASTVSGGAWTSGNTAVATINSASGVVTPVAAGTATMTYTVTGTGGCANATATRTVTVTAAPTAGTLSGTQTICSNGTTTFGSTVSGGAWTSGNTAVATINSATGVVTPVAAGTATMTYTITGTGGCANATATRTVTVTAAPTAGTLSGTQTICSNGTTTFGSTVSGGAWTSGNTAVATINSATGVVTPVAAGTATMTYTVTGTGGCANATATRTVTVTAAPSAGTLSGTQTICSNGTTTFGSSVSGGAWTSGNTAVATINSASGVVTPVTSGTATMTYTVTGTGGCANATATRTVTVSPFSVGGSVSGTATICSGATSGLLTLSGHTGNVIRWESAVSPFTTWTPIANTATTYTSDALTQETKFRAVVQNGACAEAYSSAATLSFASTTWNGTSWVGGEPTANKALIISANYTSPGANYNLQGCSLTVQNNAVVTVVPQDSVILSGALTVTTGSTMTFEAQAHLIQSGTTNLNSGTVIVKANSSPIKRLDYTLWSAPVAGQQMQAFSPLTLANRFYNYDSNTNFYTVVTSPSTTSFETAKGVLIRVANTHSASQPQSWTGTFTGVPNSGTYTIPLANFGPGKRFTLVGNPYPSPMDPEAFITNPNNAAAITGTLYLWRKTNGSNKPSYCTFNLGGFITNGEERANEVANLPYQVIQTGQGFFVEGTGAGSGNVVFDNTMRVDDHTNSFLRTANTAHSANTVERNRIWLNVTNAAGAFSQAMIGYVTNATNGFDMNYDGKYINDGEIALASVLDAEPYAIQCKALPFSTSDVIPMQFTATTAGTYSIAVDRVDGLFASGQAVYLRDTVTGTVHNLSDGAYSFATESGTFNARFEVVFQASTLGVTDPVLTENQVVIYKTPSNEISINTGNFVMDHVMIYDLAGRLLFQQKDINNSQALIKVGFATEVLLVKIKTQDGKSVTKKVLFPRTTLRKDLKISTIQVAEDE
ncbi:hypothetical protein GCM10022386_23750 [Flavobacterium cheonhonense]|uniref:T9SS sorting signal type C domain-containing protein n=1 Tax=Flavobacterium cheonhonense TaxID=706185 RepID=A0ABP7U738_9FLAO